MNCRIILICSLCVLITNSCRDNHGKLTVDTSRSVVSEVRIFFDRYYTSIKHHGLKGEFEYLDSSGDFFWVPPGYSQPLSYDEVVAELSSNAPRYISVENTLDSLRVVPLSAAFASYTAKLRSVTRDTAGVVTSMQLIESGVLIKREGNWKLLSGQTAVINP